MNITDREKSIAAKMIIWIKSIWHLLLAWKSFFLHFGTSHVVAKQKIKLSAI